MNWSHMRLKAPPSSLVHISDLTLENIPAIQPQILHELIPQLKLALLNILREIPIYQWEMILKIVLLQINSMILLKILITINYQLNGVTKDKSDDIVEDAKHYIISQILSSQCNAI